MARNTTYSSDPAASDFPSQSAPVPPASPFRRPASDRAAFSSARPSHRERRNAEILDFERLSARRNRHDALHADIRAASSRSAGSIPQMRNDSRFAALASDFHKESSHARQDDRRQSAAYSQGRQDTPEGDGRPFFEELKRTLRHRKADREFESQAPASDKVDGVPGEDAPRAGVYKGEMGRSQRKSARMQADRASAAEKGFSLPFHISLDTFRNSRPARISALVCACLILACAFVYPSAKDAYVAIRNQDQAQAEYQAILSRNDEIQNRVNLLKTDEGMEDLARSEYGYVFANENAVKVIGLSSKSIAADAENQTAAVASGSVPAPDTWYSPFLDKFFGYNNGASSSSS